MGRLVKKYCYEKAIHVVTISFAVVFGLLVFSTARSLFFSSDLMRGVLLRAIVERRSARNEDLARFAQWTGENDSNTLVYSFYSS